MKSLLILVFIFCNQNAFAENPDQELQEKVLQVRKQIEAEFSDAEENLNQKDFDISAYNHLDPKGWVPTDLLKKAVIYFEKNKSKFRNQKYMTVVDFSPRSNMHRFFIIDLISGSVDRFRTTHGAGSDTNKEGYAESFGNVPDSKKSSLGYVRTAEVYSGSFGRSLRLDGLSSTNSRMRERAIVFHGWAPVVEANQLQPLSWGCVTSDLDYRDGIINKIKNGSLMLIDLAQ